MEPRGCNRWQLVANAIVPETVETSEIRCHALRPHGPALHTDHPANHLVHSFKPDALTERLGWTVFERRSAPERSRAELSPRRTGANPPPPFRSASPALARYAIVLALDDVVDLEHLRLARKRDPDVPQHWHEALTERVELLARVPDLADPEVTVRLEGDVILESLRQPVPRLLEAADGFVVLFGSHTGRGREAGKKARLASVHDRCRGRIGGGH